MARTQTQTSATLQEKIKNFLLERGGILSSELSQRRNIDANKQHLVVPALFIETLVAKEELLTFPDQYHVHRIILVGQEMALDNSSIPEGITGMTRLEPGPRHSYEKDEYNRRAKEQFTERTRSRLKSWNEAMHMRKISSLGIAGEKYETRGFSRNHLANSLLNEQNTQFIDDKNLSVKERERILNCLEIEQPFINISSFQEEKGLGLEKTHSRKEFLTIQKEKLVRFWNGEFGLDYTTPAYSIPWRK